MLEARDLRVRAGDRWILKGVSIRVMPGEIVCVLGPNGAGKSTLVSALCGTGLSLESGRVLMDGAVVPAAGSPASRAFARRRAVLSQQDIAPVALPSMDVVLLGRIPSMQSEPSPHDLRTAALCLLDQGAGLLGDRMFSRLSGGERRCVSVARAAAQIADPPPAGARYLILDEPTNNLDLHHQHQLLEWARRLAADRVGVLCVLHDINVASRYADRLVVLQDGCLVAEGRPRDVLTPFLMRRVFRMEASIQTHPLYDCPLVVPLMPAGEDEPTSRAAVGQEGEAI